MRASQKITIVLVFLGFLTAGSFFLVRNSNFTITPNKKLKAKTHQEKSNFSKISVNDTEVFVEIADSQERMIKGLSGRKSLLKNEGMLFVWNSDRFPTFWMKDMNFAIDIIWINDGKVVGFEENAEPEPGKKDEELKRYYPPEPIDAVLEVNAGFVNKNKIKVGDSVKF